MESEDVAEVQADVARVPAVLALALVVAVPVLVVVVLAPAAVVLERVDAARAPAAVAQVAATDHPPEAATASGGDAKDCALHYVHGDALLQGLQKRHPWPPR